MSDDATPPTTPEGAQTPEGAETAPPVTPQVETVTKEQYDILLKAHSKLESKLKASEKTSQELVKSALRAELSGINAELAERYKDADIEELETVIKVAKDIDAEFPDYQKSKPVTQETKGIGRFDLETRKWVDQEA